MGSYLEVCGWSGCEKIPVTVIGETEEDFQIEAVEPAFYLAAVPLRKASASLSQRIQ